MQKTIVILGSDGYTGWPLVCNLLERGDRVVGVDNLLRRERASPSTTEISGVEQRKKAVDENFDGEYEFHQIDIRAKESLKEVLSQEQPDAVVNLAQIPSAPYSMENFQNAWTTQDNNIRGSLSLYWILNELGVDTHVVQLATMGEYGTPDSRIPEGFLDNGRPAPKDPGSLYHCSKVNTTVNSYFLSKTWGIPTTEIYQGIVYGVSMFGGLDERLLTRFDVDSIWGTMLNRFTAQAAVGEPLTVYGEGGQKRAMLSLADCIQCLTLVIDNPPQENYRAINQFDEAHRVIDIAEMVSELTGSEISHIENPRVEDDSEHFYNPEKNILPRLGYEPTRSIEAEIGLTWNIVRNFRERIKKQKLLPDVDWKNEK